jgi:DNA adenine methylase
MIETYWNQFNMVTKDHFYQAGGKLENRKSVVEALVFNFDTNIAKHNYEYKIPEQQMFLFDKGQKYSEAGATAYNRVFP